jgi:AcrR family transcriptional regulator
MLRRVRLEGPACPVPGCEACGALRDATARVAVRNGARGLTFGAVAEEAGLCARTAGEHYGDLEACAVAAYEEGVARLHAVTAAAMAHDAPRRARLLAAADALVHEVELRPDAMRFCIVESWHLRLPTLIDARLEARRRTVEVLADAHDAGASDLPPARFEVFAGGIHHALTQELERGQLEPRALRRRVRQVIDLFEPVARVPAA